MGAALFGFRGEGKVRKEKTDDGGNWRNITDKIIDTFYPYVFRFVNWQRRKTFFIIKNCKALLNEKLLRLCRISYL